ncbi:MAG: amidohydrolase family protein, partial [Saprospiraceae bacterium]|nr:amidohydrolase family protein [Saprospiraceae bacterium]
TLDSDLPGAKTKIADIKKASDLKKQLDKKNTYLLHLAEGIPQSANKHFKALKFPNSSKWAINEYLGGIHAVGLFPDDYKVYGQHNGNIIWSPMSNLLLYGKTADVKLIKEEGIKMAIGSDWSPSGSKNLLNEIKVAKLFSDVNNNLFSDEELVRMVTSVPAEILQWQSKAGSIEAEKKADLIVIKGDADAPYKHFIEAREKSINWVLVGGVPRFGITRLMQKFTGKQELIRINKLKRKLNLEIGFQMNEIDLDTNFKTAQSRLKAGLRKLPELAVQYESANNAFALGASESPSSPTGNRTTWVIDHDHTDSQGSCMRHHIPLEGDETTFEASTGFLDQAAAIPLSQRVEKSLLDVSNVEDDKLYFKRLATQINLPEYMKLGLPLYYDQKIQLNQAEQYRLDISKKEKDSFNKIFTLKSFKKSEGILTINDKLVIIDQARAIIEQAYVHLIQKNAMYAANPIDRLRVLRNVVLSENQIISELEFHRRMTEIFTSLRDLHTLYQLPEPYASKVAYLPFFVEQYYEGEDPKYIISKTIGNISTGSFGEGVEVTHWNGMPIQQAILVNGRSYAGSNDVARFARGLDSLTFRPLKVMLPPEAEWVNISYLNKTGRILNKRFQWKVGSNFDLAMLKQPDAKQEGDQHKDSGLANGFDITSKVVQETKRAFFGKLQKLKTSARQKRGRQLLSNFKAQLLGTGKKKVGYIRIYSFNHPNSEELATEFKSIIDLCKARNLIIDIRNNPGGSIHAAEYMLQALTKKKIAPQSAQFLNSKLAHFICDKHSGPQREFDDLDLTQWYNTLKAIKTTGAKFSVAYPITPVKKMKKYAPKSDYNCVLITDALSYSASDIFASGFKDNKLGKILGVDSNTGAGGANVWSLSSMYQLTKNELGQSDFFNILPYGADIHVAVRRMIRTGDSRGIPLEDLGVVPDEIHLMTKKDLLQGNNDLIDRAIMMF